MAKYMALALLFVAAQDKKDETETDLWTGSVVSTRVDAFAGGSSSDGVRFGLIDGAEAWTKCWKRLQEPEPKVDFKKSTVLFVCYEKWPGALKVGEPVVEDGVMTVEVALDDQVLKRESRTGMHSVSSRCHYDYSCRALSRADLKKIKVVCGDKELGEIALARAK